MQVCDYKKIYNPTDILEKFLSISRIVAELKIKSIHEIIEGYYRIIYRVVNKQEIHTLTIHRSRKRLTRKQLKKIASK